MGYKGARIFIIKSYLSTFTDLKVISFYRTYYYCIIIIIIIIIIIVVVVVVVVDFVVVVVVVVVIPITVKNNIKFVISRFSSLNLHLLL